MAAAAAAAAEVTMQRGGGTGTGTKPTVGRGEVFAEARVSLCDRPRNQIPPKRTRTKANVRFFCKQSNGLRGVNSSSVY